MARRHTAGEITRADRKQKATPPATRAYVTRLKRQLSSPPSPGTDRSDTWAMQCGEGALTHEDGNEHAVMLQSLEDIDLIVQLSRVDLVEYCKFCQPDVTRLRDCSSLYQSTEALQVIRSAACAPRRARVCQSVAARVRLPCKKTKAWKTIVKCCVGTLQPPWPPLHASYLPARRGTAPSNVTPDESSGRPSTIK